eukprot:gene5322-5375_t
MHCNDAPCAAVCPVDCFFTTADGVVLHSKDLCIGCGYCFYACPFGAPQYPKLGNFGSRGKMDKCTYCSGGPEGADGSAAEYAKYGANRMAEGKLPLCAEMCSTKSLLAGDGQIIAQIYRERVLKRGYGSGSWGWQTAYQETINALIRTTLLAGLVLAASLGGALAQPATREAAPTQGFNPDKVEVREQDLLSKLRNVQGTISIPDGRAATLIQPDGRTWRDYRRGPLLWITAACVLGMTALLALFFVIRGRIRIEGGRGMATLLRFGAFERFMHWVTATSWCILAISGLNVVAGRAVLLPLIGNDAFTTFSEWMKFSHNFLAFPFIAGVLLMFLVWVRHNIPNRVDVAWFKAGGGFIGHSHPAAEKFNGGQKAIFWIVVLGGGGLAVTGLALMFPFYVTDITGMQLAQVLHGGIALLMIAAMLGHIYIGSIGMEGAIDAMASGTVDLKWAKEHHSLWEEAIMRMFLVAVVVMVLSGLGAAAFLSTIQKPADVAFATQGARIDPGE